MKDLLAILAVLTPHSSAPLHPPTDDAPALTVLNTLQMIDEEANNAPFAG